MAAATMYQTTLRRRICVMMPSGEKLFFCSSPLIGSRRKSNWNYGMITVTIIMINLISGMKVIKNGRLRKQKLRLNAYCLASIKMAELVCSWRREERDRKILDVTHSYFQFIWCEIATSGYILTLTWPRHHPKDAPRDMWKNSREKLMVIEVCPWTP